MQLAPSAPSTQYQFLLLVTSSLVLPPYLPAQHPGRPSVTPIIHQPGAIDLHRYQYLQVSVRPTGRIDVDYCMHGTVQ